MTEKQPKHPFLRSLPLAALAVGVIATACDVAGERDSGATPVAAVSGTATDSTYDVAVLERKPALRNLDRINSVMEREYPRDLQDAGIGGTVQTQFVIEADGRVDMSSVRVIDSPHQQLSDATVKTVEEFRFAPGRYQGTNVRVRVDMPITWKAAG